MQYVKGNLLDSSTQALVNTVNTVGVMGKGIALQFKEAFPNNFKAYTDACKYGELQPGKLLVFREHTKEGEKIIVNFPTKTEWYLKSKYEYVEEGLRELVKVIEEQRIQSIAIPPLGCGNGGLKWEKVKPIMEQYLGGLQGVEIQVYEPNEAVRAQLKKESNKESKLTPARAMLLYALYYYEAHGELMSLFVANKLSYLLKRLGAQEFKKLSFQGHHYGPYSVGVEHLLYHINGKYLKGLEQGSGKAFESLELQYDKAEEVSQFVRMKLTAAQRNVLTSLLKLIQGFETAFSLELLATVDFIQQQQPSAGTKEIIQEIANWSVRKQRMFQPRYVEIAVKHLADYSNSFMVY